MRRSRSKSLFVLSLLLVLYILLPSYNAQALDANATAVADGMHSLLPTLDSLPQFAQVTQPVPFTTQSISDTLSLDNLFTTALDGPLSSTYNSLPELQTALEMADTVTKGVTINFDNVIVAEDTGDNTLINASFDVLATREVTVPLTTAITETNTLLAGGSLSLTVTLASHFDFQLDTTNNDPFQAFYLTNEPVLAVGADASGAIESFNANHGLMSVTVAGNALINLDLGLTFVDPDSDGRITRDEWVETITPDLITAGFTDAPGNDLDLDLTLTANPLDGAPFSANPSATLQWQVAYIADGLGSPQVTWQNGLDGFTNLTADELLTGIAQAATALVAAQTVGDMPIPFIDGYLSDAFLFSQPLIDFVKNQGIADIVCGPVPGDTNNPPSGDIHNVPAGETVYCRAYTLEDPTSVTWTLEPPGPITNDTSLATAGPNPTQDVSFTNPGPGKPDIRVELTLPEIGTNTVFPRFDTVQELFEKLRDLGGFSSLTPADVEFDPATYALTYHLQQALADATASSDVNFGDQIEDGTGLHGLIPKITNPNQPPPATASIGGENISLDLTFGVTFAPGAEAENRFFIRPSSTGPELAADMTAEATIELLGRIGFVNVEVMGDADENPGSDKAFDLGPADETEPMFALDINATSYDVTGTGITIPNAVGMPFLMKDVGDHMSVNCNVAVSAGLAVTASVSGLSEASGGVHVDWPDVFHPNSCQPNVDNLTPTADIDFQNQLQTLDLSPAIFGEHDGPTSTNTLTDTSGIDFTNVGRELVGIRVTNKTTGSSCVITEVTPTAVSCESDLQGGKDGNNMWTTGDKYEIESNPFAMLNAILDSIEAVASELDTAAGTNIGGILDTELPLLPISPNDLITQYRDIQNVLDEIRTGGNDATVACGPISAAIINGAFDINRDGMITEDGEDDGVINGVTIENGLATGASLLAGLHIMDGRVDLNGDDDFNNDNSPAPAGDPFAVPDGAELYCWATIDREPDTVEWHGSGTLANTIGNQNNVATVGTAPSEFATFTVEFDPTVENFSYAMRVTYTDAGGRHGASLPSRNPPTSLAGLEMLLEERLGLPQSALTFDLVDLPPAGQANPDGTMDLVLRLGYGVCTKDNEVLPVCAPGLVETARMEVPVSIDLSSANIPAGLIGFQTEANLFLEYQTGAQLDLGMAINSNLDVVVLETTGFNASVAMAGTDIELEASVGPIGLLAGTSAVFSGMHTSAMTSTTTLTDTSGVDFNDLGIDEDDIIFNTDDGSSCMVTAVTTETVTCAGGLSGGTDNYWEENDDYQFGGQGAAKFGVQFDVDAPTATPTTDINAYISGLDAGFSSLVVNGPCSGDGCAVLSLALAVDDEPTTYLGDLSVEATLVGDDDFNITASGYDRIADRISSAALDWLLLFHALPELLGQVESGLAGAAGEIEVPLIGDALDAGADVAGQLEDIATELDNGVSDLAADIGNTPADVEMNIADYVDGVLDDLGVDHSDTAVTVSCDGPCGGVGDIEDVRVTVLISDTIVDAAPTFDLGVPGVPLRSAGALDAEVTWSLLLDFGLNKDNGPYLVAHDNSNPDHGANDNELGLSATVGIGVPDDPDIQQSCTDNDPVDAVPEGTTLDNYSPDRCMLGELAFMQVHLRDGENAEQTSLTLDTGLNVLKGDAADPISLIGLRDLVNGSVDLDVTAVISADVNLRLRTGLVGLDGFPTVLGTFELEWEESLGFNSFSGQNAAGAGLTKLEFGNLFLNGGSFMTQFMLPIAEGVQNITSPLMPVIETVSAPLPVLSDLSRMTGGEDISLLTLMEEVSGSDLTLLKRLLAFVVYANKIASLQNDSGFWVDLGDLTSVGPGGGFFSLDPAAAVQGVPTSGQQRDLINLNDLNVTDSKAMQNRLEDYDPDTGDLFGLDGLTFPFIQEPMQIFAMLIGEDATLVRYDAGTVRATASVDYTFRFAVGPIPMSVSIIGTGTLEGRFAMGFDTYGIRQVVNGGNPAELFDGIFIDDLDANGRDVPEITLKGTIAARAAVDIVIVSAGVEGGIELTVELDLDDRPDPDGKLRIDEIANKLDNPICLFIVTGRLDAYFAAFVKIDLFLFSKTYKFELARVTLLDFEHACEPPNPKLAKIEGSDLILLMGSQANRNARGVAVDEIDEDFTVRLLADGSVSVAAFGEYQTFKGNFTRVVANADDGNDVVSIESGASDDGSGDINAVPFTLPVLLNGGEGDDELRGGEVGDEINGGGGNDTLFGGAGNDTINGGANNDSIDGGLGNDIINGDGGDDRLNGGPGADTISGGADDDQVTGGPGTDNTGEPSDDLGDILYGNSGRDALTGGFGNDKIYGDDSVNCTDETSDNDPAANADALEGGPGDDQLYGGPGNDELIGGGGDDTLCGNGNDDLIRGDGDEAESPGDDDGFGGVGNDTLYGDDGNDTLHGDDDNDIVYGNNGSDELYGDDGRDRVYGGDGGDTIYGDDGLSQNAAAVGVANCEGPVDTDPGNADCLYGENGNDIMHGEGGHDHMFGDAGDDTMNGNAGEDFMRGGQNNDFMYGNADDDTMYGDSGQDLMHGNDGDDFMRGGIDADTMFGDDNDDTMYGDGDDDVMEGNAHDDLMYGNAGDDYMEGNEDVDTMHGGLGQDDMIGGSDSPNPSDSGDFMYGSDDHDVMLGDNGDISRTGNTLANGVKERVVTLYNLASGNNNTLAAGNDVMEGNAGRDQMFGGGEVDTMNGNEDDDYMEGNGGSDTMEGNTGQDDMIGGTSQEGGGTPDAGDKMHGNEDYDVLLGDNAAITRDDPEVINTFNDAVVRHITLFDVATLSNSPSATSAGGDILFGDEKDDLLYGQGNKDDIDDDNDGLVNEDPNDGIDNDNDGNIDEDGGGDFIHGNGGEDYIEGNSGVDWLFGDDGNDDMVGGTGRINNDGPNGTNGRLDGGDVMYGGSGFDVMAGDNALLVRTLVGGQWVNNTYNDGIQHERRILLDENSADEALVSGGDTMYGDDDDDLMYGQGSDDTMFGGNHDDVMEGNQANDTMQGNAGQDDMLGGTIDPARYDGDDTMYGNEDADVMLGDNGTIDRPLVNGLWQSDLNTGDVIRDVVLYDVETIDNAPVSGLYSGDDTMQGNEEHDIMFGQGGDDTMDGNGDFDYMEGNAGSDTMDGGAEADDMIGGGSANDGVIDPDRVGDGLTDADDTMYGGDNADVMTGDNARLLRLVDGNGLWQIDPNTGEAIRDIQLFDVETVNNSIDPRTSGSDLMYGNDGRDLMFGQGNDMNDADGDGHSNEDPADGLDNDRDGRESVDSVGYDCEDGRDNDEDGLLDAADPDCAAAVDEDGRGDLMYGGDGDDYMEGNHGSDWMFGDGDQDDMLGGNSAGDGHIGGGVLPTDLRDGDDVMWGGDGDDVMIGDNGGIVRSVDNAGFWLYHTGFGYNIAIRVVSMAQTPESEGAAGNDYMHGDADQDEMYGQLGHDFMAGDDGDDAMVGDLGLITTTIEDGSREQVITIPAPFFQETIYGIGTLTRRTLLYSDQQGDGAEGNDTMLGGAGDDNLHGVAGNDFMNGNGDNDHLFGGDGDDAAWGGTGNDHLYGGYHDDHLDVVPREEREVGNGNNTTLLPADPPEWFTYGPALDSFQDIDIIYGGWDQDAMQADVGGPGPVPGDRLVDWAGGYNVYYVCPPAYGEGLITRMLNPALIAFLQQLSEADGAVDTATQGTTGFRELAMVFPNEIRFNSHPPHPDHPGHFTCVEP